LCFLFQPYGPPKPKAKPLTKRRPGKKPQDKFEVHRKGSKGILSTKDSRPPTSTMSALGDESDEPSSPRDTASQKELVFDASSKIHLKIRAATQNEPKTIPFQIGDQTISKTEWNILRGTGWLSDTLINAVRNIINQLCTDSFMLPTYFFSSMETPQMNSKQYMSKVRNY